MTPSHADLRSLALPVVAAGLGLRAVGQRRFRLPLALRSLLLLEYANLPALSRYLVMQRHCLPLTVHLAAISSQGHALPFGNSLPSRFASRTERATSAGLICSACDLTTGPPVGNGAGPGTPTHTRRDALTQQAGTLPASEVFATRRA